MGSGVGPSSCVRVKDSAHYFIHKVNSFNECSERDERKRREKRASTTEGREVRAPGVLVFTSLKATGFSMSSSEHGARSFC